MPKPGKKPSPDWDSFETWKGDESRSVPAWIEAIFHWFMVLLGCALVFGIAGALVDILGYRLQSRSFMMNETADDMLGGFIGGGIAGVIGILSIYFGRIRKTWR